MGAGMSSYNGTSQHRVDDKGRVSVPAALRHVAEALSAKKTIHVTRSGKFPCLECHDLGFIGRKTEEYRERQIKGDIRPEDQREMARLFGIARAVDWDGNGRVVLPKELAEAVGITEECVFYGQGVYFEIWEPKRFAYEQAKILDLPVWEPVA